MTRTEMWRRTMAETANVLRKRFMSVTELAEACEITRQGAYGRIAALKDMSAFQKKHRLQNRLEIAEKIDRVANKGPKCNLYKITSGDVLAGE